LLKYDTTGNQNMLGGHAQFIVVSCGYETFESMNGINAGVFSNNANDLYGSNDCNGDNRLTNESICLT
jgi:hypothetical protein